jgi:hypothetical protein
MRRTLAVVVIGLSAAAAALQAQNAAPQRYVVIGCVSQDAAAKAFLLTDSRRDPPAVYRLDWDAKLLPTIIGQTVEVSGTISPGANKQPPTIKAASLIRISTTCAKGK